MKTLTKQPLSLNYFDLQIPDERDLEADDRLSDNELRVLEIIACHARGVAGAWIDRRVVFAASEAKGWSKPTAILSALARKDLIVGRHIVADRRPTGRVGRLEGTTIWRLTDAGHVEHFAQRGRLFA